jgi:hypothetical protein
VAGETEEQQTTNGEQENQGQTFALSEGQLGRSNSGRQEFGAREIGMQHAL